MPFKTESVLEGWKVHIFLAGLIPIQCCSGCTPASREGLIQPPFLESVLGSILGLNAINPSFWADFKVVCLTLHVSNGLAHWPYFQLPGIDSLTPGIVQEPDFYHPVKTAVLPYFSSGIPRIRPYDELKHLNRWSDFKRVCHDHLPLKLRTCLSVKSPVHP